MTEKIFTLLAPFRTDALITFVEFLTYPGMILTFVAIGLAIIIKKSHDQILFFIATISISWGASEILKRIFQIHRPDFALIQGADFSFPSSHATISFAIWPLTKNFTPPVKWLIRSLLFIFPLTRLYLGMHYLTDLFAGAFLGLAVGYFLEAKNQEKNWTGKLIEKWKKELEFRRQIAHLIIGTFLATGVFSKFITQEILAAVLACGGLLIIFARKRQIPVITRFLEFFERKKDIKIFPGKGAFFLMLGSWLTALLFSNTVAAAAILIMAVGDSFATIIGHHIGKIRLPHNKEKTLEGSTLAFIMALLAATFIVPFHQALIVSFISMLIESLPLKIKFKTREFKIDDNLIIPIVAGTVLKIIGG